MVKQYAQALRDLGHKNVKKHSIELLVNMDPVERCMASRDLGHKNVEKHSIE